MASVLGHKEFSVENTEQKVNCGKEVERYLTKIISRKYFRDYEFLYFTGK